MHTPPLPTRHIYNLQLSCKTSKLPSSHHLVSHISTVTHICQSQSCPLLQCCCPNFPPFLRYFLQINRALLYFQLSERKYLQLKIKASIPWVKWFLLSYHYLLSLELYYSKLLLPETGKNGFSRSLLHLPPALLRLHLSLSFTFEVGEKEGRQPVSPSTLGNHLPCVFGFWSFALLTKHCVSYETPKEQLPYLENILSPVHMYNKFPLE